MTSISSFLYEGFSRFFFSPSSPPTSKHQSGSKKVMVFNIKPLQERPIHLCRLAIYYSHFRSNDGDD